MKRKSATMAVLFLCMAVIALVQAGCVMGPDYHRPSVKTPDAWRFSDKEAKDVANTAWWEQFNDPVLNGLIGEALTDNKDILIATARIEQYLGQLMTTRSALFPQASAAASATKTHVSERGPSYVPGANSTFNQYQGVFNVNWELDFWGRVQRQTESARAGLLSSEEARRAVLMTLVVAVANAYIDLRTLDCRLEIALRTLKSRKESLDLFKLRFAHGITSELTVSQVESEYEATRATIPVIEKGIAQKENELSILLGKNPGSIPRGKSLFDLTLPAVPAGLPSELLEKRPDLKQAEQDLIAANAQIGAAKAQYFPSISLTGSFGWTSTGLTNLFTGPARAWNYSSPLSVPLFTAGQIEGQVKTARSLTEQALLKYQQTIQQAFREVEDGLIGVQKTREQLEAQGRQVVALKSYYKYAWMRYENGYTSYMEVLDAERSLFNAETDYATIQGSLFSTFGYLYKAMGGGWIVEADKLTVGGQEKGRPVR